MTIDIILPLYNAYETVQSCLNSICDQKVNAKLKVHMLDDASTMGDYNYLLDKYKDRLDMDLIRFEDNRGPGVLRKYSLEHTNGEFILFMDADDVLYEDKAIARLLEKIQEGYDVAYGLEYIQEIKSIKICNTNMHGKLYRRKYLDDNNIEYIETRYHDDNYFNSYVVLSGANVGIVQEVVYIYIYNKKSLTKSDENVDYKTLEILFQNMNVLNKKINYSKHIDRYKKYIEAKYAYINRIYKEVDEDKKKNIIKWVNKYDSNNKELLKLFNKNELINKVEELYE